MKQKILSLITLVVFGTGFISAQSTTAQDKRTVSSETKRETVTCPGDTAHSRHTNARHIKAHHHGQRPGCCQGADNGKHYQCDTRFGKKQMRKHHGKGMRRNMNTVKSTPKCKCATCVELRKQEQLQEKIDSMRKEAFKLQHELDSLRGFVHHKGNMPPVEKKK